MTGRIEALRRNAWYRLVSAYRGGTVICAFWLQQNKVQCRATVSFVKLLVPQFVIFVSAWSCAKSVFNRINILRAQAMIATLKGLPLSFSRS